MANTKAFELGQLARRVDVDSDEDISFSQDIVFRYLGFDSDFASKTTDDLPEGSGNLYYTTVRANTDFDFRLTAKTTTDINEGNNLYYTLSRVNSAFDDRIATKSTTDLAEGNNLYYTTAKADSDFDVRLLTKTTDNLSEGTNNVYYTTARANSDFDTRIATKTTSDLAEGNSLYYTRDRVDSAVNDLLVGGRNVSLVYDDLSGSLTIIASADEGYDLSGNTTDDLTEGSNLYYTTTRVDSAFDVRIATKSTDDLAEGSQLYYTTARADSDARHSVSGAGDISYDPQTGVFSIDVDNIYTQQEFESDMGQASTTNLPEGTNLYYTTSRADSDAKNSVSAVTSSGFGGLSYNSTLGEFTYVGPSTTNIRDQFSGGLGVTITNGVVAIGQPVDSSDDVTFASIDVTGNVVIGGNLQVTGSQTLVQSSSLNVTDNMIYMNAGESDGSPQAFIDIGFAGNYNDVGSYAHAGFFRDATDGVWKVFEAYTPEPNASVEINTSHASFGLAAFQASTLTGVYTGFDSDIASISTTELSEGSNLYFTDARADSAAKNAVSASDTGGDGSLSYNPVTGVFTYTGPNATEVRAHFTAGEGIDIAAGVISGEDASTTNKGIAKFNSADFAASSGDITIKTGGVSNDQLAGSIANNKLVNSGLTVNSQLISLGGSHTFTTTDIGEGTNLYYTQSRFDSALSDKSTSDLSEGSRLYYTLARFDSAFAGKTTAELTEQGNLYYTDARFDSAFGDKTTTQLTEGTNKYFTNERVDDRIATLVAAGEGVDVEYDDDGNVFSIIGENASTTNKGVASFDGDHFVVASGAVTIKATSISNDDLAGSIANDKLVNNSVTILGNEVPLGTSLDFNTDSVPEGSVNVYFTETRARDCLNAVDAGGDGSFGYDSSTGTFTYNGPTASEIRSHFTAGEGIDISSGQISAEVATSTNKGIATFDETNFVVTNGDVTIATSGVSNDNLAGSITNDKLVNNSITILGNETALGEALDFNTDSVPEGSANLYFTNTRADDRITTIVDSDYVTSRYNSGAAVFGKVMETLVDLGAPASAQITCNTDLAGSFFVDNLSQNIGVDFTNVTANDGRTQTFNIIIEQGVTPYAITSASINGSSMTVHWIGGEGAIGYSNAIDIFSFTLLRVNNSWKVLASCTPYMT